MNVNDGKMLPLDVLFKLNETWVYRERDFEYNKNDSLSEVDKISKMHVAQKKFTIKPNKQ